MTKASLKEVLGRLGPIQDVAQNPSGSSVSLVLRSGGKTSDINAIAATRALAKCGLSLLQAKRAVEKVIAAGEVPIHLPKVVSTRDLADSLRATGIQSLFPTRKSIVHLRLRKLRKKLDLTQEQFSVLYGFELKTLQKYEQGEREPTGAIRAYLELIEKDPIAVKRMRFEESGEAVSQPSTLPYSPRSS